MKLHELSDRPGSRKTRKRIGRGIGSGKGKTGGRLGKLQAAIDAGRLDAAAKIDAAALVKAGILRRAKDGVRLLGDGEIKAKVTLSVFGASKSAVAAVEKAGGSVEILAPKADTSEQAA